MVRRYGRWSMTTAMVVLLVVVSAGAAIAGWSVKRAATYDGCQYEFLYGWWYLAPSTADTDDMNGGCQYQYVKGWDADEVHLHGYTSSNPAYIQFSVRDSQPNTVRWSARTWEHGWYADLQLSGQGG